MIFVPQGLGGLFRLSTTGCNFIMPFYAVVRGNNPGIYDSWDKCKANVEGFPNQLFKSFKTQEEALNYLKVNGVRTYGNREPAKRDASPDVIEIMDSDVNSENIILVHGPSTVSSAVPQASSNQNIFDFASFSQRLTNLEDTYKKKVKELEQRIKVLESGQLLSSVDKNKSVDIIVPSAPKPSDALGALQRFSFKRTSSAADWEDDSPKKKPKTTGKVQINSTEGFSFDFNVDGEGYVIVYSDGACVNNGRDGSRAGVGVWFGDNHPLNISEPVQGRSTNNMAEIQAATWAIQQGIRVGLKKICVKTDSMFTIRCITQWMKRWKRNGWKTGKGQDVINRAELEVLDKACQYPGINIKWEHVLGHNGEKGNEAADALARKGAQRYKEGSLIPIHPWQQFFTD